jgi:hypothetical protein
MNKPIIRKESYVRSRKYLDGAEGEHVCVAGQILKLPYPVTIRVSGSITMEKVGQSNVTIFAPLISVTSVTDTLTGLKLTNQ